jgi:hypothetical protein
MVFVGEEATGDLESSVVIGMGDLKSSVAIVGNGLESNVVCV